MPSYDMTESGLIGHPTPNPYPFGPPDVASVLDAGLAEHPDRLAIIDGDRTWTWSELDAAVALAATELEAGQLCWWPPDNAAETIISILATFRAEAIWLAHSTNPSKICEAFSPSQVQKSSQILAEFGVGLVSFTSGTTGTPKAVAHSEHSMLGPGLLSIDLEPPQPDERIGTPLDIGNANIFMLGPLSALLRGSTFVVLPSRFAPTLAVDIDRFDVTRLFAVPTLAFDLADSDEVEPDQLSSLDRVILGGSGAAPTTLARFADRFGVRPTLSYGMSEAPTGVVRESLADPIGSGRGFPLPHVEVVIVGLDGQEQPPGTEGEVCLRAARSGPWAGTWTGTLGYFDDPERTAALFTADGLLHTGDKGRLDDDGAVRITGRLSKLIIRGGKNVDPTAIEAVLAAQPGIAIATVIGLPDERLGQRIGASVILDVDRGPRRQNRRPIDRSALRDAVRAALSNDDVPDVIISSRMRRPEENGKVRPPTPGDFSRGDYDYGIPRRRPARKR